MLLKYFLDTRERTVAYCTPLAIEDYVPQSAIFTSPPKWHLAHTTWFFEQMILKKYIDTYAHYDEVFNFLFNSYYQSVGKRSLREHRGLMTRPSIEEIYGYRDYVDKAMVELIKNNPSEEVLTLIILGINHEQQHQELLLSDIKYTLSHNPINPLYKEGFSKVDDINKSSGWAYIEAGVYEIGHQDDTFSFDNELGVHRVFLEPYSISNAMVTNSEYIEFIEAGGYSDFNYWLDEGWNWATEQAAKAPLYWEKVDGQWFNFTLGGFKKVQPDGILCHISFYEAFAYARWKGMRLPTEFEWEVASAHFDWGKRWEWTYSAYLPYPGFKIDEGAVGEYNGKFMINQMVLRGASSITTPGHSRYTYRNFFHPMYRWQYTGIRLVK